MTTELRAYFEYAGAHYRVTVSGVTGHVWVERQTPRAFAGNLPVGGVTRDDVLVGAETWILAALPSLFDAYERQYAEDE